MSSNQNSRMSLDLHENVGKGRREGAQRELASFRYVLKHLNGKKVLDVGCAEGIYLKHFSDESIGMDFLFESTRMCKQNGLNAIAGDSNSGLPFKDNTFDAIFCSHVLEHVFSPFLLLKEFNRIVKEHGTIIIGLPQENSIFRILVDDYYADHDSHIYGFSLKGIKYLLERTGFEVEKSYVNVPLSRKEPLKTISDILQLVPHNLLLTVLDSYWVVARKMSSF